MQWGKRQVGARQPHLQSLVQRVKPLLTSGSGLRQGCEHYSSPNLGMLWDRQCPRALSSHVALGLYKCLKWLTESSTGNW